MGKYAIRPPFSLHLPRVREIRQPGGKTVKNHEVTSHFSAGPEEPPTIVDLDDPTALAHMHKLEPVDEPAKALFDKYHAEQAEARKQRASHNAEHSGPSLAAEISGAIVAALIEAGVIARRAAK